MHTIPEKKLIMLRPDEICPSSNQARKSFDEYSLKTLSESIAARMRHKGVKCTVVQVTIKDPELHSIVRQEKLSSPTCLASEITAKAMELIRRNWNMKSPIRMLTVTGGGIVNENDECQISFFDNDEGNCRREKLEETLFNIKEKYGKNSVISANRINNDIGI